MKKLKPNWKVLNIRMSKELWLFFKNYSAEKEISMNEILVSFLNNLKDKNDNRK